MPNPEHVEMLVRTAREAIQRSMEDGDAKNYTTEWLTQTLGQIIAHAHNHMDEVVVAYKEEVLLNPLSIEDIDHGIFRLVQLKNRLHAGLSR